MADFPHTPNTSRWDPRHPLMCLLLVGLLVISSSCTRHHVEAESPTPTTASPGTASNTIRIATFNIQNFGKSKANKPEVMSVLASVIRAYDVVAVQEVSDVTGSTPQKLLNLINKDGVAYGLLVSPRSGGQENDRGSQEQYAYYYRLSSVKTLGSATLYDDHDHDRFQREPYVARFGAVHGRFTFVLVTVHTRPEEAVAEIGSLHQAILWAKGRYSGEDDFIALGDFNAGCSYAKPTELNALEIRRSGYLWIVPDDADTNLAAKRCAYDRIVATHGIDHDYTGRWDVDRAFTSKTVSDHWPVWAEFYVDRDE